MLLNTADNVFIGASHVAKVYLGSTLLWPPTIGDTGYGLQPYGLGPYGDPTYGYGTGSYGHSPYGE